MKIVANNRFRLLRRISDPAGSLLVGRKPSEFSFTELFHVEQFLILPRIVEGKTSRILIPFLLLHPRNVDRPPEQSRRRSGFQSPQLDPRLNKAVRKRFRTVIAHPPAFVPILADMHQRSQEGSGSHNDRFTSKLEVEVRPAADHTAFFKNQPSHGRLKERQILLQLQSMLQAKLIRLFVVLNSWSLNRRSFRCIQQLKLNSRKIGI